MFNNVNFLTNKPPNTTIHNLQKTKGDFLNMSFSEILKYFIETIGNFVDNMHSFEKNKKQNKIYR